MIRDIIYKMIIMIMMMGRMIYGDDINLNGDDINLNGDDINLIRSNIVDIMSSDDYLSDECDYNRNYYKYSGMDKSKRFLIGFSGYNNYGYDVSYGLFSFYLFRERSRIFFDYMLDDEYLFNIRYERENLIYGFGLDVEYRRSYDDYYNYVGGFLFEPTYKIGFMNFGYDVLNNSMRVGYNYRNVRRIGSKKDKIMYKKYDNRLRFDLNVEFWTDYDIDDTYLSLFMIYGFWFDIREYKYDISSSLWIRFYGSGDIGVDFRFPISIALYKAEISVGGLLNDIYRDNYIRFSVSLNY